ncbi:acyltransferase [uncultured Endozoicomonas sp.]|uniref:acyltransferase family protein n=1 Tax=uncultured Endozoicomonas sp. TaxID=432652 RepID=UPI00261D5E50|nr:acyltransferase [uncultured Endozoicomonas sp.]
MRIVALDIVRFFAALSVVLYHLVSRPESDAYPLLSEVTQYGYLGVPLFFMISGFVIVFSAMNRSAMAFALSRFMRLYPTLWVGVVFTVFVTWMFADNSHSFLHVMSNLTLLQSYLGFMDIDGIYWTLKAELKFYLCIFLLIQFKVIEKISVWLSIWLLLTVLHTLFGQPFFMGWFISPSYSSFFMAGVVFFLIKEHGMSRFNSFVLMATFILSSYYGFIHTEQFITNAGLWQKMISVLFIWSFYGVFYLLSTGRFTVKQRNVFLMMGGITYPLYLIHNVAGKAIIDYCMNTIPESVAIILVVLLMLFVAWLIHAYVENRLITPVKKHVLSLFK